MLAYHARFDFKHKRTQPPPRMLILVAIRYASRGQWLENRENHIHVQISFVALACGT